MKTVIYIDVLLVTNFFINLLLLSATAAFLRIRVHRLRLLCGTLIGTACSLVLLIPDIGFVMNLILKTVVSICMSCVVFAGKNLRGICRQSFCFFAVSCFFAGFMLLIKTVFSSETLIVNNATTYFAVGSGQIVVISAVCYVCLRLIINFVHRTQVDKKVVRVSVICDTKQVDLKAFVDSGNHLFDPISQKAVSLVNFDSVSELLPTDLFSFFSGELSVGSIPVSAWNRRICLIPAHFAVGESLLPAFRADKMIIITQEGTFVAENPLLAVTKADFFSDNTSVLLHPSMLNEEQQQERIQYETITQQGNTFSSQNG